MKSSFVQITLTGKPNIPLNTIEFYECGINSIEDFHMKKEKKRFIIYNFPFQRFLHYNSINATLNRLEWNSYQKRIYAAEFNHSCTFHCFLAKKKKSHTREVGINFKPLSLFLNL